MFNCLTFIFIMFLFLLNDSRLCVIFFVSNINSPLRSTSSLINSVYLNLNLLTPILFYFNHVIIILIDISMFVIIAWIIIIVLHNAILSASLLLPCFSPNALAHDLQVFLNQVIKFNFKIIVIIIILFP